MATDDTFRRGIKPNATSKEVHDLVWSCSAYPFVGDVRKIRRSIRKYMKLGGGTVNGAIQASHDELDREMAEFQAKRRLTNE